MYFKQCIGRSVQYYKSIENDINPTLETFGYELPKLEKIEGCQLTYSDYKDYAYCFVTVDKEVFDRIDFNIKKHIYNLECIPTIYHIL